MIGLAERNLEHLSKKRRVFMWVIPASRVRFPSEK